MCEVYLHDYLPRLTLDSTIGGSPMQEAGLPFSCLMEMPDPSRSHATITVSVVVIPRPLGRHVRIQNRLFSRLGAQKRLVDCMQRLEKYDGMC